ncbi:uncharacterized protein LOC135840039 [Planococcus citri]|uniref:uncharacterized protein LOC135840039 n=1 Tax=Planococcus citri TaxID=170843 RepID=UPI0031F8EAB8
MNSAQLVQRINGPSVVQRTQTVIDTRSTAKPIRHFGISPTIDKEENDGSVMTFTFVSHDKFDDGLDSLPFSVQQNQLTTALKLSYPYGIILQSKEKSAAYPVIQFSYGTERLEAKNDEYIIQGFNKNSCIYKEMRVLEGDIGNDLCFHQNVHYIILGFKTTDVKYNQALLESWRDWTGARHIYINFPEQLNLIKITLYHKQTIEDVNLFSYIVVVKCDGITTKEKETILLDFVQRFRAEMTSNFVSVYQEVIT